jgi:competence ComEA-like helix-hairpin-helix protein
MSIELSKKFGLTSNEFKFISFLLFSFIFGLILNQFFNVSRETEILSFDYSYQDSLFKLVELDEEISLNENNKSSVAFKREVLDFNDKNFIISKKKLPAEKSINLNSATKNDLINLPGIGNKTAEEIIKYRQKVGKFRKLEELKKVKGIGDKKFEKIIKYIYIK